MTYHVELTKCDCHPETCAHWKYVVVDQSGVSVAGADSVLEAMKKCVEFKLKNK